VKARLAAEIDLGKRHARSVEHVGDRFLVATDDVICTLDGETLVPVIEAIDVIDMHGDAVLTPRQILVIGGAAIPLPTFGAAVPAAFLPVPDGAIVAFHDFRDTAAAAVIRIDGKGNVRWRAPTPPPATRPKPLRVPSSWVSDGRGLCISGDRVLATFEMSLSGISASYGLDIATGQIVYETALAPYQEIAPAPAAGSFLVGAQGYGAFETELVDRDGRVVTTWRSHGIALPGDPPRIVELCNVNTALSTALSYVTSLRPDGTVRYGARLPGYYTSRIVAAADGSFVFWRDDAVMRLSADGAQLERMLETPGRKTTFAFALAGVAPGRLVLSWTAQSAVSEHKLLIIDAG
jgi:hypothetical protein